MGGRDSGGLAQPRFWGPRLPGASGPSRAFCLWPPPSPTPCVPGDQQGLSRQASRTAGGPPASPHCLPWEGRLCLHLGPSCLASCPDCVARPHPSLPTALQAPAGPLEGDPAAPPSPLLQPVPPPLHPGKPTLLNRSYAPRVYISQYADCTRQHIQNTAPPAHEEAAFQMTALRVIAC